MTHWFLTEGAVPLELSQVRESHVYTDSDQMILKTISLETPDMYVNVIYPVFQKENAIIGKTDGDISGVNITVNSDCIGKEDDSNTADKLFSIIDQVEKTTITTEEPKTPLIANTNNITDNYFSDFNFDQEDLDIPCNIDSIAPTIGNLNGSDGNNELDISELLLSLLPDSDELPNRLYNLIAEAMDEMSIEDLCLDSQGDDETNELSHLVDDAIKYFDIGNQSPKYNPENLSKCSGIAAIDIGTTCIYLTSFMPISNNVNKTMKNEEKNDVEHVTAKTEKPVFTCHHCNAKWSDFYMVKSHILWNHVPELENKQVYRIIPSLRNINVTNRIYKNLQKLAKKKSKEKPEAITLKKSKNITFKFRILLRNKIYKCQNCEFENHKKYELRKHKAMVHHLSSFKCEHCEYRTSVKSCLQKHVMAKHTKEKPNKCSQCDYSATQYITLQEHIMAKHSFNRPHKCPDCNYASVQRSMLKDHIKSKHTHTRNRQCPDCSFVSVSSATLRRHIMAKHTLEKPYKCQYCDYSATQSGQLKKHVMAVHTNQKPFQCPQCPHSATQSYSLRIHIRRKHAGDTPVKCIYCRYKCGTNANLKSHIKNKHKYDKRVNPKLLL